MKENVYGIYNIEFKDTNLLSSEFALHVQKSSSEGNC